MGVVKWNFSRQKDLYGCHGVGRSGRHMDMLGWIFFYFDTIGFIGFANYNYTVINVFITWLIKLITLSGLWVYGNNGNHTGNSYFTSIIYNIFTLLLVKQNTISSLFRKKICQPNTLWQEPGCDWLNLKLNLPFRSENPLNVWWGWNNTSFIELNLLHRYRTLHLQRNI